MKAAFFTVLLAGAMTAGIMGLGVAKPVVKGAKKISSLRQGSTGHYRRHGHYSGK